MGKDVPSLSFQQSQDIFQNQLGCTLHMLRGDVCALHNVPHHLPKPVDRVENHTSMNLAAAATAATAAAAAATAAGSSAAASCLLLLLLLLLKFDIAGNIYGDV
jgi:hypothetical protein